MSVCRVEVGPMIPSDKSLVIQPDGRMLMWDEEAGDCIEVQAGVDEMVEVFGPTRISVLVGDDGKGPEFVGVEPEDNEQVKAREQRVTLAWRRWRRLQDEFDRLRSVPESLEWAERDELGDVCKAAFWRWVTLERQEAP